MRRAIFRLRLRAAAHAADQVVSRDPVALAKLRRAIKLDWVGQGTLGLLSHLWQPRFPEDFNDVLLSD